MIKLYQIKTYEVDLEINYSFFSDSTIRIKSISYIGNNDLPQTTQAWFKNCKKHRLHLALRPSDIYPDLILWYENDRLVMSKNID